MIYSVAIKFISFNFYSSSYSRCIVCKSPPTKLALRWHQQFENEDEEALKLGLALLHGNQRFFSWCIKTCKHRDFRSWRCAPAFKTQKLKRKKQMQRQFKKYLGLSVDFAKPGSGTTTTGMTAKKAFKKPKVLAKIVHIPYVLIKKWKILMDSLNSGWEVDPEKYDAAAKEWLDLFHGDKSVKWSILNATIHLFLIHGKSCIKVMEVAPFFLSEEGLYNNWVQNSGGGIFFVGRTSLLKRKTDDCRPESNDVEIFKIRS